MKNCNIFSKIVIVLALAIGWGGSAWAQGSLVEGKTYYIKAKFASANDDSYLTNGGTQLEFEQTAQSPGSYWIAERSGNADFAWRFQSKSDPTKYLDANSSTGLAASTSEYANFNVNVCGNVSGVFHLNGKIGSGDNRTNLNIGTWGYTNSNAGFGRRGNGAWGTGHSNSNWTTDYEIEEVLFLNGNTNISFVDTKGQSLTECSVNYTNASGDMVPFTASTTSYDFGEIACPVSSFATTGYDKKIVGIDYNSGTNTLTLRFAVLMSSNAPHNGSWASGTRWYTLKNVRAAKNGSGYMATEGNFVDEGGNMKLRVSGEPEGESGLWTFVSTTNGYYLYNRAKGPNYVMGTTNNQGDANTRSKMYEGTDAVAGVTKTYTIGANGDGIWICLAGSNKHLDDGSSSYLTVWDNGSYPKTSEGNRFLWEEVELPGIELDESDYTFEPTGGSRVTPREYFDIHITAANVKTAAEVNALDNTSLPVVMPIASTMARASYTATSIETLSEGNYRIHFGAELQPGDYMLSIPAGTFYQRESAENCTPIDLLAATYMIEAPSAASGYKVIIKKEASDASEYSVTTSGEVKSGRTYAYNDEYLDLTADLDPKDVQSLTIDAPANKFVWGPVVDNAAKTITFEVRSAISSIDELTEGFYQLQMTDEANITKYNAIAKPFNTKSQYVYVAPWYTQSEYQNDYTNKYTGVPSYAGAPSTFYYLSKSGSNVRVQSIYGHYFSRLNTPNRDPQNITSIEYNTTNNTLSFDGWTKEGYWTSNNSNGTEGPRAAADAGKMEHYHVSKVDLSGYDVYRVNIEGWAAGANIQSDPRVTYRGADGNNLGLPTVYHNGYFFFKKGYEPVIEDFTVVGKTYAMPAVYVTAGGDIKELTFSEKKVELGVMTIRIEDESHAELTSAQVLYTPLAGEPATLTSGNTYDFKKALFNTSLFSGVGIYSVVSATLNEETNTITFVLKNDPNIIQYSSAPAAGKWADDTKWFTIRNFNAGKYASVDGEGMDSNNNLKWRASTTQPTDAQSLWCFVKDGENGFYIYNKAFGPDFVLTMPNPTTNSPTAIKHKNDINQTNSHFDVFDSNHLYNNIHQYCFALHTNHGIALNNIGGTWLGVWSTNEATHKQGAGSAFLVEYVEDEIVNATTEYTAYKINTVSLTGDGVPSDAAANSEVSYKKSSTTGQPNMAKQGAFLLIRSDLDVKSVTASNEAVVRNAYRVSNIAGGITSATVGTSTTTPSYRTIDITGVYDVTSKYIVHRPNGLLWKAKKNKIDGTKSYTVGTQTPDYTEVKMGDQNIKLQHTSQLEVTHFVKPGDDTPTIVWFTTTSSSSNSGDGARKRIAYARMFNYDNEFDNSMLGTTHSETCFVTSSFLSTSGTTAFKNGYVNPNVDSGNGNNNSGRYGSFYNVKFPATYTGDGISVAFEWSRLSDASEANYADGDEPTGAASYLCDIDENGNTTEGFTDPNHFPGVVNMLEGTIAQRQIVHLLPAKVIADKLYDAQGDKYAEEETIMFPAKYNTWKKNNDNVFHNVIPLGYNAVDYFGYTSDAKNDYFHLNYNSADQGGIRMYAEVEDNDAGITINTMNNDFTNCTGVFVEAANNKNSRSAARYISFCYPSSGTIGNGNEVKTATIVVKLTNGTKTYNVKRFKLIFQPNTDPIPHDEIFGHDDHNRSDAVLEARFGKPYEEMCFKAPAQYNFTLPASELHNMGNTLPAEGGSDNGAVFEPNVTAFYQFPMDFDQMSYAYYGGTRWVEWGEYGLRHYNTNATHYLPVNYLRAKYQKSGLQSKKTEYENALSNSSLTEIERAHYQQLLDDASKAVDENQAKMTDEFYNGYFIYCDASEQPGEIAKLKINEQICPGTQFYVTAWMSNNTNYTDGSHNPNSVLFRIKARLTGTNTYEQIMAYCPGQITKSVHLANGNVRGSEVTEQNPEGQNINVQPWQQVAFNFTNTAAATKYDEFRIEVDNISRGSAGADILLDNIRLYMKRPEVQVRDAAPVCGQELDLVRITTDFDAMMESIKGNTTLGAGGGGMNTYYGVYAIIDKAKYEELSLTEGKEKAFVASLLGSHKLSDSKALDGTVIPSLYAFHSIKFYDDFAAHDEITYNDLITSVQRDEAGRMELNGVRTLCFNCKIEDNKLEGGKEYILIFSVQADENAAKPEYLDNKDATFYANYFNLLDNCRIIYPFTVSSANMVRLDGASELDPYRIEYCAGSAPNIKLTSYSYNVQTGKPEPEVGVAYDWYYGTLAQYRAAAVTPENCPVVHPESDKVDHTLDQALMNLRHFYPTVSEENLNTVVPKSFETDHGVDYILTECMIAHVKTLVESGKLKLYKTNALFNPPKVDNDDEYHSVVAVKISGRVQESEEGTYIYCAAPIEIKFYTNNETPAAAVGLNGVDYVNHTPYNVRDQYNNLISVPTRINSAQIRKLTENTKKTYLRLPIDIVEPSGYYKTDVDDGHGGKTPKNTDLIKFILDPQRTDVVVVETNDPQWKLYEVSGTELYLPVVGKLKEVIARKNRKNFHWLQSGESDQIGIDFSDPTIQRKFEPREGYYYVLRANFLEETDGYDVAEDDPLFDPTLKDQFTFRQSELYQTDKVMRCPGTILVPLKIVPEYMKWTGREGTDWNNDRNWVRADYSELTPSAQQNHGNPYSHYAANVQGGAAGSEAAGVLNGLPTPTNDAVERQSDPAKKYQGLDIYIPMETTTETSTTISPYTFGYAPTEHTSVIIPSGAANYPALVAHAKSTDAAKKDLLELNAAEKNTSIIEYDMVAKTAPGNYFSAAALEAKPYYENTVKDITFQPGAVMYGAQHLSYEKAWVEYAMNTNRWYTAASPLQNTYSGDWYSPTAASDEVGKQLTPYFQGITYSTGLNDRFAPAYYQRSWDKGTANVYQCQSEDLSNSYYGSGVVNAATKLDWSKVYNDVNVDYSNGGFSVKPVLRGGADGEVLVRMPKEDASYLYFHAGNTHGGTSTQVVRNSGHHKLFSDKLKSAESFTQTVTNDNGSLYYLVANPFMAPMDMAAFFAGNADNFEAGAFWVLTNDKQTVSVQDAEAGTWSNSGTVAPCQSFFVKKKAGVAAKELVVNYTAAMQAAPSAVTLGTDNVLRIVAQNAKGEALSEAYVKVNDDDDDNRPMAELLLDSNLSDHVATVYTATEEQAMQFNTMVPQVKRIPLGIIAPGDQTTTIAFPGSEYMSQHFALYDALNQTTEPLSSALTISVTGNSLGRYFIINLDVVDNDDDTDEVNGAEGDRYDLQGIRVNTTQHGQIYIQNRQRVIK